MRNSLWKLHVAKAVLFVLLIPTTLLVCIHNVIYFSLLTPLDWVLWHAKMLGTKLMWWAIKDIHCDCPRCKERRRKYGV
jgi:hypothetical protein